MGVTFTVAGAGGAGGGEPTAPQEIQIKESSRELAIKNRDMAGNVTLRCAEKIPREARV